ncbi:MAG TPA: SDR family NAD(P)-dependent oxidoreductase [Chitinophagales bacterium]|nr:SDR family NAD(P)-dependent oxidoreductase [Chitinophagales bacterium]HNC63971.1 SDR family NAD(P)-dependent oxidoreductase [Chitinophagales bacterium]HNL17110.1 SDR family NAD(P)-dependent oxidoreductase [Chitinophagales bacterium]
MANDFLNKYGAWAVITGASSGIGAEYAKQIAAKGLNIVLVARRKARMEALASELEQNFNIQTKIVECDVAMDGFQEIILNAVKDLDIGLLINNAGINCEGQFFRGDLARNTQMIQVNVKAPFVLAYEFAKKFVEKGKGGIIFTSSISAFNAHPYLTHYAATKAYILSLAEGMNYEFKDKNIDILALCPGMTKSEMTKGMKDSLILMEVQPVVETALATLGNSAVVVPGFINKFQTFVNSRVLGRISARNFSGALLERVLPGVKSKKGKSK